MIVEFISQSSSCNVPNISADALAASMYISLEKSSHGILPEFQISADLLRQKFGWESQDITKQTSLDQSPFQYSRISKGGTNSFLAFGIQKPILSEVVLRSIINSANLWKDNVNFALEQRRKILVEFSSPNIAKPFHAGHLRSTILGNFVANVHEILGHEVIRLNYLGDWGTQLGILIKGYQLFGDESKLQTDPISHLFHVYVQANKQAESDQGFYEDSLEVFRKLENDDPSLKELWHRFRELSIDNLTQTYTRLGLRFDSYEGESMYQSKVNEVYASLQQLGLLKEKDDGTRVFQFNHQSGVRDVVLQKSDGTSMYLSRDIAAAVSRMDRYKFDKMFYVVENGQSDHFLALFDVLKQMGYNWASHLQHVKFGRLKGMSTRKGEVVLLSEILDEAKNLTIDAMKRSPNTKVGVERLDEIGDILGVASVLVNDMRTRRLQDSDFNWSKITQTKGDTGLFLLYVHARLCSLEDNCGISVDSQCDLSPLVEPEVFQLVYQLARYEDVCTTAYLDLQPCSLVQYLFTLGRTINSALDSIRVKGQPKELAAPRILTFSAARKVLSDGMKVLGLCPLHQI